MRSESEMLGEARFFFVLSAVGDISSSNRISSSLLLLMSLLWFQLGWVAPYSELYPHCLLHADVLMASLSSRSPDPPALA